MWPRGGQRGSTALTALVASALAVVHAAAERANHPPPASLSLVACDWLWLLKRGLGWSGWSDRSRFTTLLSHPGTERTDRQTEQNRAEESRLNRKEKDNTRQEYGPRTPNRRLPVTRMSAYFFASPAPAPLSVGWCIKPPSDTPTSILLYSTLLLAQPLSCYTAQPILSAS